MNNKFDELTKAMAQSVTRRAALKKFGVGLVGMALACFGLANKAGADPKGSGCGCASDADCRGNTHCADSACVPNWCTTACCCHCSGAHGVTALPSCARLYSSCVGACGTLLCHK